MERQHIRPADGKLDNGAMATDYERIWSGGEGQCRGQFAGDCRLRGDQVLR